MGRQALGPVGGPVVSYWAEAEVELEEEVEVHVICGSGTLPRPSFPSLSLLGSFSSIVGETLDPRDLQRIFTGCLHLWFCCDLTGGGTVSDTHPLIYTYAFFPLWPLDGLSPSHYIPLQFAL